MARSKKKPVIWNEVEAPAENDAGQTPENTGGEAAEESGPPSGALYWTDIETYLDVSETYYGAPEDEVHATARLSYDEFGNFIMDNIRVDGEEVARDRMFLKDGGQLFEFGTPGIPDPLFTGSFLMESDKFMFAVATGMSAAAEAPVSGFVNTLMGPVSRLAWTDRHTPGFRSLERDVCPGKTRVAEFVSANNMYRKDASKTDVFVFETQTSVGGDAEGTEAETVMHKECFHLGQVDQRYDMDGVNLWVVKVIGDWLATGTTPDKLNRFVKFDTATQKEMLKLGDEFRAGHHPKSNAANRERARHDRRGLDTFARKRTQRAVGVEAGRGA